MKRFDANLIFFIVILILYIVGQMLIGTYHPGEKKFVFDAPSDVDFLYYGAIINSLLDNMPPENPAFSGVKLTQPFIQYYPAALLAKVFNPYSSIRILNLVYLVLFWMLLKNIFPDRYGIPLAVLFASSTPAAFINASGVDFIARGFTHLPFFLLITLALFGRNLRLRTVSTLLAALINGYLMLIILPYLLIMAIWQRKREDIYILASSLVGLAAAALIVSSAATEKPFYFIFSESFRFSPWEILRHATPFLILAFFYRNKRMLTLLVVAVAFGSLIHYNPFFPVFMVYFSGAMLVAGGERRNRLANITAYVIVAILFVSYLFSAYDKYNPREGRYYPRYDSRLDGAINWVSENTGQGDAFMALTVEQSDIGLIMQHRPVYLGYIGHVSHLGLNWEKRYDNTIKTYRMGQAPDGIDYIFYGPTERKYFPNAHLPYREAYRDSSVSIFRLK